MKPTWHIIVIVSGILLTIGTILWSQPRLRLLVFHAQKKAALQAFLEPGLSSRTLWQRREFASIGTFENLATLPQKNIFTDTFPPLSAHTYRQVILYHSDTIESVDLIIDTATGKKLSAEILSPQIDINTSAVFERNGKTWVAGVYDEAASNAANGYFFERKQHDDSIWIHISWVRK